MMLLLLIAGAYAQTPAPFAECLAGEFAADGYTTGQNIDLDYGATAMSIDSNGDSLISVGFLVPKVYTTGYDASAYSITFNRDHNVNALVKDATVGMATTNDNACFTNRFANDTQCSQGLNPTVWVNNGAVGMSPCVDQTIMTIGWSEAMTNNAFGNTAITDDGTVTRVYVTATVETWRKFHQTADPLTYLGQMTGNVQLNTNGAATGRVGTHGVSGSHYGDGGDLDVEFGPLEMNDWRYTLYQIPFYLVFPKTVIVQTSFQIGTQVTVLTGVVSQDIITVNFNPNDASATNFAVLDVVVTTKVQYPYAIRGPQDGVSPMLQYVGDNGDDCPVGQGCSAQPHAATIEFESFDDGSVCIGNQGICTQDFKLRIVPFTSTPCSVAGDYYLEFWAECVNGGQLAVQGGPNGCSTDVELEDSSLAVKRTSNGFFDLVFTVQHQDFCPKVMDTVKVAVDLKAYHDEAFSVAISNAYNGIPTDYNGNANVVYSNDIIFYEATYRTASAMSGQLTGTLGDMSGTLANNANTPGNDDIIDYVRAIKIFVDIYLGVSSQGAAVNGWQANWKDNLSWQLGGTRIPGPNEDFDDSATTVTGARVVQVPTSQPADSATWRMIMCEVAYIDPKVPIMTGVKPADCFTAESQIAHDFFDFDKVMSSSVNALNTIDENEIAFKMRLDERVLPVGPLTDNSHITVTVESEVYYIGNQHPTRRLLQTSGTTAPATMQNQKLVKSMQHMVYYKNAALSPCTLDDTLSVANLDLELDFTKSGNAPTTGVDANTWAMNFKMQLESELSVQNSVFVTLVKGSSGVLLDTKNKGRRLAATKQDLLWVELVVKSTKHTDAGKIANIIQSEIAIGGFKTVDAFNDADVTAMTSKDCTTKAPAHNSKLASSAPALFSGLAFVLAIFANLF